MGMTWKIGAAAKKNGAAAKPAAKTPQINLEVKPTTGFGPGVVEVTVKDGDKSKGSSYVVTSPRSYAFRKKA
jgi:hypothetical protein